MTYICPKFFQSVMKPSGPTRFMIIFVTLYGLLQLGYFMISDNFLRHVIYHYGFVSVSADVINFFTPQEHVAAYENKLLTENVSLEIVRGCDSSGVAFLIISAILAFSASFKHKLAGLFSGLIMVYLLNQIRIIGLYFVITYKNAWFLLIHTYFAPTLIVVLCCIFFAWWTLYSQKNQTNDTSNPA